MTDELEALRQRVAELEQANDYLQKCEEQNNADIIRYKNKLHAANARAAAAEKWAAVWKRKAKELHELETYLDSCVDELTYLYGKASLRADAAEKRVRELENTANLATQYLAGSDEHEAIAVLDKALAHDTTEAKDWEYLGLEEFAKGYDKDEQVDTPASPPPLVTDEERNLWRQRAETAGDAISYEWQKEKRRADAAEKESEVIYRALSATVKDWRAERARADAAEALLREADDALIWSLDEVPYISVRWGGKCVYCLEQIAEGEDLKKPTGKHAPDCSYQKALDAWKRIRDHLDTPAVPAPAIPPPLVTDETLARMAEYYEQQEPPAPQAAGPYTVRHVGAWWQVRDVRNNALIADGLNAPTAERIAAALNAQEKA